MNFHLGFLFLLWIHQVRAKRPPLTRNCGGRNDGDVQYSLPHLSSVLPTPPLPAFVFRPIKAQVANTRPMGRIQPSILFYPAWHLVSTQQQRRAPSLPLVKEQLRVYSPKITVGSLKATTRLMWPPVKRV